MKDIRISQVIEDNGTIYLKSSSTFISLDESGQLNWYKQFTKLTIGSIKIVDDYIISDGTIYNQNDEDDKLVMRIDKNGKHFLYDIIKIPNVDSFDIVDIIQSDNGLQLIIRIIDTTSWNIDNRKYTITEMSTFESNIYYAFKNYSILSILISIAIFVNFSNRAAIKWELEQLTTKNEIL